MSTNEKAAPTIVLDKLVWPEVMFSPPVEATPASVRKEGNTTYHDSGTPGEPGCFQVKIDLPAHLSWNGVQNYSSAFLRVPVPSDVSQTPYREMCFRAYAEVPQLLRSLADQVENELVEIEKRAKAKEAEEG